MLRSLKDLEPCTVCATDGDIGNVMDLLLDDELSDRKGIAAVSAAGQLSQFDDAQYHCACAIG